MTDDRAERARVHLRVWRDKVCEAERVPDLFEYERVLDEVEGILDEAAPSGLLTKLQTKLFGEGGRS